MDSTRPRSSYLVPLGALLCYLLLGQEKGYGDGPGALLDIRTGATFQDPVHFLYMPMVAGVHTLLAPLGVSLFTAARLLSAVGVATGVWLLWRATRLLDARPGHATRTALLVAACPGVVFFATVVEYHGPFLAFAALATLAMAALVRRPAAGRAALLGAATGLAFFAHATGHLLPCLLLPCFLALVLCRGQLVLCRGEQVLCRGEQVDGDRPRASPGQALLLALLSVTGHVGTVLAGTLLLHMLGAQTSSQQALTYLEVQGSRPYDRVALWPITIWHEFLRPLAPLSLAWWLGFLAARNRPLTWAFLLALVPFLAMCVLLVPGYNEHGAYLLPLAWVLAWILVRSVPAWLVTVLLCLGITLAVVEVCRHDDAAAARSYAAGVRELGGGRPTCLVIGKDFLDYEAAAMQLPEASHFDLARLAVLPGDLVQDALPNVDRALSDRLTRGETVLLSDGAWQLLLSPEAAQIGAGPVLSQHLRRTFDLQPAAAQGFRGYRVLPPKDR